MTRQEPLDDACDDDDDDDDLDLDLDEDDAAAEEEEEDTDEGAPAEEAVERIIAVRDEKEPTAGPAASASLVDTPVEVAPGCPAPSVALERLLRDGPSARLTVSSVASFGPTGSVDVLVDTSGRPGRSGARGRDGRPGKDGRRKKKGGRTRGSNGGNGTAGKRGTRGGNARSVRVRLEVRRDGVYVTGTGGAAEVCAGLDINASGGGGGYGGDGGSGGRGGSGNPSGERGRSGAGGDGADGGDGANVTVTTRDPLLLGLIRSVDTSAGRGGSGGSGSPYGRSGQSGSSGELRLVIEGKDAAESDTFGLSLRSLQLGVDSSLLNGNLTRGSAFVVQRAVVQNVGPIPIPADVSVEVDAPRDWVCSDTPHWPIAHSVDGAGLAVADEGTAAFAIPLDCPIGGYRLHGTTWCEHVGLTIPLDRRWMGKQFEILVNHRLGFAPPVVEADGGGAAVEAAIKWLDPLAPSPQLSSYAALLVRVLQRGEVVEDVGGISKQLEGALFDGAVFRTVLCNPVPINQVVAMEAVCLHFFRSMPRTTREKAFDAAWYVASQDKRIDEEERALLVRLATGLGLGEEWMLARFPTLGHLDAGGRIRIRSNALAHLVSGPVAVGIAAASTLLFSQEWTRTPAALGGAAVTLGLLGSGGLLLHRSCPNCGGLDFSEVARPGSSPLDRGDESWVCQSCGARAGGSGERALRHGAFSFAPDSRAPTAGVLSFLALIGVITGFLSDASLAGPVLWTLGFAILLAPFAWLPRASSLWRPILLSVALTLVASGAHWLLPVRPELPPEDVTPAAEPKSTVTVGSDCDLWGFDAKGKAKKVRRALAGETLVLIGPDGDSTMVEGEGSTLWVPNRCLR